MSVTLHSRAARYAYQDLLRLHLEENVPELIGSVEVRARGGRHYLYDKFRIGTEMKSRYLGEGTPELRARLARAAELKAQAEARQATVARLARVLRAEGFIATDRDNGSLLIAFARAGVFRSGGVLVGSAAFALYQGELGVCMDSEAFSQARDIDLVGFECLSVALGRTVEENPGGILRTLSFDRVTGVQDRQVWKWRQTRGEAIVEFLTAAVGEECIKPLPALGVSAHAQNDLDFLIANPIPAVALYRSGVLVQVPRPERFAIHKLIVAERRGGGPEHAKSRKDRGQAALLVRALADDRPEDLRSAYTNARGRGQRWCHRLDASLSRMPETAAILHALG